ncbi:MAG TPA: cupin domain-containing protein [Acetobacteraceae bacterium]|nr:cupin domain-containing protein [Acetobacteraceae bacterium]
MIVLINLTAELAKLKTLQGLTPQTTLAKGEGFAPLAPYRDSTIFAIKSSGKTAWERHPDGEEFVQILEGAATFDLISADGSPQSFEVSAGTIAIVPKGLWHRARFSHGMTLISVTPTHTEFVKLDVDDPRAA